jgi:cell wall-associated NlpC family hydrolase
VRRQVVDLAVSLAGVPYAFGGSDIDGFDCSGLVFYVFDCFGIRLPRSAREQAGLPGAVRLKRAAGGDILVFRLDRAWHSAIYLGAGRFVHAPSAGGWVRLEMLNDYWLSRLKTVIAVLPGNG